MLALAGGLSSCVNEEDDIFDSSAAERLEQSKKDNFNLLCQPANGWAMQYFANNDDEGGYTFLMKFDKNTSVKIAANNSLIGNTYKEETSMFEVIADDGPVLTFNTYNPIFHMLADPYDVPSLPDNESGYGHRGDYEFVIMEASAEKIVLRGKKHGMTVIMTPLAEDADWAEYLQGLKATANSLFNDKFDPLILDLGEKKFIVSKASTGVFNIYPEGGDAISQTVMYPYIINPEGLRFSKEVEETGVTQIYFNDQGTFSLEGNTESCLHQSRKLNELFAERTFGWRLTVENANGAFATALQDVADETKAVIKRNFNSIDFVYVANLETYALSFRNSGTSAAAYIFSDITTPDDGTSAKFNISTTEGNTNGKNRLRDIQSLTTFINLLNSTDFVLTTTNPLAPAKIKFTSKSNENDYFVVSLN